MPFPEKRDGHYYLPGPDGQYVKLPSVTTVLQVLHKPALIRWAAREVARAILENPERYDTVEKAASVPFAAREAAGDRGHGVHALIEAWASGQPMDRVPGHLAGYHVAFRRFLGTVDPQPIHVEATVYNLTHGYAGTTDLIARAADGRLWCLDFKTSRQAYFEYHLQIAAYRACEHVKTADGRLVEMPRTDHGAIVLLRDDGTYSFVQAREDVLDVFLSLLHVYRRLRELGEI